jgi:hypothetical protein
MDNAGEFRSETFDDYWLAMGIKVEYLVPHVHTQNGLAESLIKRIKWIARLSIQICSYQLVVGPCIVACCSGNPT